MTYFKFESTLFLFCITVFLADFRGVGIGWKKKLAINNAASNRARNKGGGKTFLLVLGNLGLPHKSRNAYFATQNKKVKTYFQNVTIFLEFGLNYFDHNTQNCIIIIISISSEHSK
jgi:hypothetical protein